MSTNQFRKVSEMILHLKSCHVFKLADDVYKFTNIFKYSIPFLPVSFDEFNFGDFFMVSKNGIGAEKGYRDQNSN